MRMAEPHGYANDPRVSTPLAARIARLIEPTVDAAGFALVRVQVSGQKRPVLQIMAEPCVEREMTVEDCAMLSRAISAVLDVEDPIDAAYALEVSSPGIDRPLTRPQDFGRFAGFEAKIELARPLDGRKRFQGRLRGIAEDGTVRLDGEDGCFDLAFADIAKAKLVLNDELLALANRNASAMPAEAG